MVTEQVPGPAADDSYEQVLALLGFGADDLLAAFGWRCATGYLDNLFVALDRARHHGEFRLSRPAAIAAGHAEWTAFWDQLCESAKHVAWSAETGTAGEACDGEAGQSQGSAALNLLRLADQARFGDPRGWMPLVHVAVVRYLEVPPNTPETYLLCALILLRGSLESA